MPTWNPEPRGEFEEAMMQLENSGHALWQLEINFNVVNVTAPVTGQTAAGGNVVQTQNLTINNIAELKQYVERALTLDQAKTLRPLLEEFETQVRNDSVKPSTLKRIGRLLAAYGPAAVPIADFISRLLGVKA